MLDKFVGSIKGYFYQEFPIDIYIKELPETIKVPSMFFPQPNILHLPFSKQSYQVNYTMNVQLFEKDTPTAMQKAESIAHSIRKNKSSIPLLNNDGTRDERNIVFSTVSCESVEEGIVQIRLEWEWEFNYK